MGDFVKLQDIAFILHILLISLTFFSHAPISISTFLLFRTFTYNVGTHTLYTKAAQHIEMGTVPYTKKTAQNVEMGTVRLTGDVC